MYNVQKCRVKYAAINEGIAQNLQSKFIFNHFFFKLGSLVFDCFCLAVCLDCGTGIDGGGRMVLVLFGTGCAALILG